jgi:predicted SAM-dependent methyltransferase
MGKRLVYRAQFTRLSAQGRCKIIVGASGTSQDGWIALEQDVLDLLRLDHWRTCFRPNAIDAILAEHVWEHLTSEEGALASRLCFRFLKVGGHLRVAVPDGFHPSPDYRELVRPGGIGCGAEDHKVLFTHETLTRMFVDAGFRVRLLEFFDERGAFHGESWSADDGYVSRSLRFDPRNNGGQAANYTSIILDAQK